MQKLLLRLWPVGTIILVVLIFFYPVWLQSKVPLPADFVVGTYYPWLDYKWGYDVGVPVKNPITTDVVSFIYPMRTYAVEILKQGIWPLWNPLILSGTPLLANFQSAPFSPTNIFYFIFGNLDGWSLQIIFQPLLAAFFLYLLLREFGLSKLASVSGGLFFSFAGFITIWLEWNAHSLVAAFFPLVFLLTIKWIRDGRWVWGFLLSISFTLQIFSGYPQIILYEVSALSILVIFYFQFNRSISLGFFLALGVCMSGIQILPALELLKYSQRGIEDVINVSAYLPWQYLITFFAPDFFGNHSTGNWWGEGDYTLVTGYSGIVVAILASLATITNFKEKNIKFALCLIVLALLISLPNPLSVLLKESGLLGLQAASAHRSLVLSNLGFAILAAFGLDILISGKVKFHQIIRAYYLPAIFLTGFGIAAFYGLKVSSTDLVWTANFKVALRNLILPSGLLSITFIIFTTIIKIKKNRQALSLALMVLAVFELFRFGWKFTPFSDKELVFPKTPVLEFLQTQKKPFRVTAEAVIPINMMMAYGIETTEGYDAVYPLQYANYLAALNSNQSGNQPQGRYGSVSNYNSNLLNVANTKYVLALLRNENGSPYKDGKISSKFTKSGSLKPIYRDKSVLVLENTKTLDRAKIFYNWEVGEDDIKTLNTLLNTTFAYQEKLVLSKESGISQVKGEGNVSYSESPTKKIIKVVTDNPGILFVGDSWFPGWKAFVDGEQVEILRANYNFMAVSITEIGEHEVTFKYEPETFKRGSILSVGSLIVLILLTFSFKMRRWIHTSH